jgi:hypothetical protein
MVVKQSQAMGLSHFVIMREQWQKITGIRIATDPAYGNFETLIFPSEQDYAFWLMKWS